MVLIIGGDSLLGSATYDTLCSEGVPAVATTRRREQGETGRLWFDLADPVLFFEPPGNTEAAVIFAALSRLSDCADDPQGSSRINVEQTLALIEHLLERGIYTLFLSTNHVFDGTTPHTPTNAPFCPISEYGRQKARVEEALALSMRRGAPVGILRLSKAFGSDAGPFCEWRKALRRGESVRAFNDMVFAPVPLACIVCAITHLVRDRARGIFQLSGVRDISYADAALHIAGRLGADTSLVVCTSARTIFLPEGAIRAHTTLASDKLERRYGIKVPDPCAVLDTLVS